MYKTYFFLTVHFFVLFIKIKASIKSYKFDRQLGSSAELPPCLSTLSFDNVTTILFKSDSGELLMMNGILISNNPRLILKNHHSAELIIKSIELLDDGQYECRTEQSINYIFHLIINNLSVIHLTVLESSNVTLQCTENGMWTIEESHRGGPVRTQYTRELVLDNIQRNDSRFQTITCSTLNGHEKREYIIDVLYKPTVKLVMSARRRLMCIICAHPLPHRIEWWWNTVKERDEHIHQTNINQSCIVQQLTFVLGKAYDIEQIIVCEAENMYGIERDSLQLKKRSTTRSRAYTINQLPITASNALITTTIVVTNRSSSLCWTFELLLTVFFVLIISMIDIATSSISESIFITVM